VAEECKSARLQRARGWWGQREYVQPWVVAVCSGCFFVAEVPRRIGECPCLLEGVNGSKPRLCCSKVKEEAQMQHILSAAEFAAAPTRQARRLDKPEIA